MRKAKYIALALISSAILSGAGYAYWNDSVTINSTVSTGKFDVSFVTDDEVKDHDKDEINNLNKVYQDNNGVAKIEPVIAPDKKTLNVKITNLYPGAAVGFCYEIENKGSIPAKFDSVELKNLSDPNGINTAGVLEYTFNLRKYKPNGDDNGNNLGNTDIDISANTFEGLRDALETRLLNWEGNGNQPKSPLVLQPSETVIIENPKGQSIDAGYTIRMNERVNGYENASLGFSLVFNFKQWNDPNKY